jgi:fumarate hydratase subunit beta
VQDALKQYKGVYFIAVGGAGALLARHIKKVDVVAYEDLGTEAVRRLEVEGFPAIVCNDIYGSDLLQEGKARYKLPVT